MKWLLTVLMLAGCGLPPDIVGPVDYGDIPPDPAARCPEPEAGSGVVSPCVGVS